MRIVIGKVYKEIDLIYLKLGDQQSTDQGMDVFH